MSSRAHSMTFSRLRNGKSFLRTALKCVSRGHEIVRCMKETRQWPSITAFYLRPSPSDYPFTVVLRNGERIEVVEPTDIATLWQIFFHRAYAVRPSERSILDVGANIGLFTLYAARQAPASTIHCIEPFPDTFDRLSKLVRENGLSHRVICSNFALTGSAGTYLMHCTSHFSQRRRIFSEQHPHLPSLRVPGITLETWMNDANINELDLMKMDIEGSEYDVLLSATIEVLRRIRRLIVEYHPMNGSGQTKHALCDHLRKASFELISDVHNDEGYGVLQAVRSN